MKMHPFLLLTALTACEEQAFTPLLLPKAIGQWAKNLSLCSRDYVEFSEKSIIFYVRGQENTQLDVQRWETSGRSIERVTFRPAGRIADTKNESPIIVDLDVNDTSMRAVAEGVGRTMLPVEAGNGSEPLFRLQRCPKQESQ